MTDELMLAQLRIQRTIPALDDDAEASALLVAAARAGRKVVDLRGSAGGRELILAWTQENPLTPADSGGPAGGAEGDIITLAACLGCCWPDPNEPLLPGLATTLDIVRDTLKPLGVQQVVRAVNRLRAWGYLASDLGDGMIRLGPVLATWSDADVERLRREHTALPQYEGES